MKIDPFRSLGWSKTCDERLVKELQREVAQGHCLYDVSVIPVAQCGDDVLFQLTESTNGSEPSFAQVHLTYKTTGPDIPPWPSTTLFKRMKDWEAQFDQAAQPSRLFGLTKTNWILLLIMVILMWIGMSL